jgi:hypothetical protein
VQIFLPFADFEETARSLDTRRLGKQRVETLQRNCTAVIVPRWSARTRTFIAPG